MRWDYKTTEQIKNLVLNNKFKTEVIKERKRIGIPERGFRTENLALDFILGESQNSNHVAAATRRLVRKFKLSENLLIPVYEYIPYENFLKGQFMESFPAEAAFYGVSTEESPKGNKFPIYIHPGASRRDVLRFLQYRWPVIKSWLDARPLNKRLKVFRTAKNRSRDIEIYNLRKSGVLKADGNIHQEKSAEYFKQKGFPRLSNITASDFKTRLGISLPSVEARRKAIARYRALENS